MLLYLSNGESVERIAERYDITKKRAKEIFKENGLVLPKEKSGRKKGSKCLKECVR